MKENRRNEIKAEIKRLQEELRGVPLFIQKPLWWKLIDWFSDWVLAWCLIISSPLWLSFWLTYKIRKWEEPMIKEMGEEWRKKT